MRSHVPTHRSRWLTILFALVFAASLALGGPAISADDPGSQNNTIGGLGAPPPNTPTPTLTPTATATVAPATATGTATTAPTTNAATPTGSAPASAAAPTSGTPTGTATPSAGAAENNGTVDRVEGGSPSNIVKVINKNDGKFHLKGRIQVNHIPGDNAQPVNDAEAYSSCTNCETFAIALQVDLISRTATTIAPQNIAVAVNYHCSHCYTSARAIQYVIQVDDPTQVPDDINDLVNRMQQELNAAAHDKDATAAQTEARVNAVIAQFTQFAQSLNDRRGEQNQDETPGGSVPPDATP